MMMTMILLLDVGNLNYLKKSLFSWEIYYVEMKTHGIFHENIFQSELREEIFHRHQLFRCVGVAEEIFGEN